MITKGLSSQQTLNKWFFSTKSLGKRERQALAVMFSLFNSLFLLLRDFMRKNIFRDIVRISKINRYFCIID